MFHGGCRAAAPALLSHPDFHVDHLWWHTLHLLCPLSPCPLPWLETSLSPPLCHVHTHPTNTHTRAHPTHQRHPLLLSTFSILQSVHLSPLTLLLVKINTALAAQSALAAAQADLDTLLAAPDGAVAPEIQGAAAIALDDAARFAAQDYLLPLNIAEASPDGQWLALGSDQLAVVLLPAGARWVVLFRLLLCFCVDVCICTCTCTVVGEQVRANQVRPK